MSSDRLAKVLELATELPEEERAELAREMIRSLPATVDEIDAEIERRLDAIDEGTAKLTPWDEAKAQLSRDE